MAYCHLLFFPSSSFTAADDTTIIDSQIIYIFIETSIVYKNLALYIKEIVIDDGNILELDLKHNIYYVKIIVKK
jgi:hypothetical protein